jgi:regulation of enolase protein 1 (concanavalin A-like superfamily)
MRSSRSDRRSAGRHRKRRPHSLALERLEARRALDAAGLFEDFHVCACGCCFCGHNHDDEEFRVASVRHANGLLSLAPDDRSVAPLGSLGSLDEWSLALTSNAAGLPLLHSLPGAPTAIYLDFDGHNELGAFDRDGDPTTFNAAEAATIVEAHRQTSVFFAMFDVNVTTVRPTVPFAWIVISNDFEGGKSFVDVFPNSQPRSWINSSAAESRVTGIVHEIGHNFGLLHQSDYDTEGNLTSEYSNGLGPLHGALMGVDYRRDVQKWFIGHHNRSASALQDDVAVIANVIQRHQPAGGDGFRADDHGDTFATATTLTAVDGSRSATGIIERMTDVDMFSFTTTGMGALISVVPTRPSGLDAKLEVFDATGAIVAASDGSANEQQLVIPPGTGIWYVSVSSAGNYGDLGLYDLTVNDLPEGWTSADVGTIRRLPGDATFGAGTFTVAGSGAAVGGTVDAFRFVWQTLTGDGSIVARVTQNQATNPQAKAGVMIRESLAANSKHVAMVTTATQGPQLISRSTNGGSSTVVSGTAAAFTPTWVRLVRLGNVITAARSADGVSWTTVGSVTVSMGATVRIGLLTTAQDATRINTARFTNVSLTGTLNPPEAVNGLTAPAGVSVTQGGGASLVVRWQPVTGATGYRIERSENGVDFSSVLDAESTATSWTNTALPGALRYFYRVRTLSASGQSAASPVVSATNRPSPVTQASIAPMPKSNTQLILNWRDTSGETGYRIERSTDNATFTQIATVAANVPSYTAGGLTSGTQYWFRISPMTATGDGNPVVITRTTGGTQAVTELAFTSKASTAIGIEWTAVASATSYRIERSQNGTSFTTLATVASGTLAYTDATVAALGRFYYRVVAINGSTVADPSPVIFTAAPAAVALPAPWTAADVGSVAGEGATGWQSPKFVSVSSGTAIGGSADSFRFTSQPLVGDGTIVARVESLENTGGWAKAGVVIRESTAANARQAVMVVSPTNGIAWQYRQNVGGLGVVVAGPTTQTAPVWVRVVRTGNTFTGSWSADGSEWTEVGSITIPMGSSALAGLVSTSDDATRLNRSEFTDVAVSTVASGLQAVGDLAFTLKSSSAIGIAWSAVTEATGYRIERSINGTSFTTLANLDGDTLAYTDATVAVLGKFYYRVVAIDGSTVAPPSPTIFTAAPRTTPLPAPWTATDLGSVAGEGATGLQSGTFIHVSSGTAIGGPADSFRFTSQPLVGDGSIIARVSVQEITGVWAKAGVMIRESTDVNARQAVMVVSPTQGIAWQYRHNVGGSGVTTVTAADQTAPVWLKLERVGNRFTGSWSLDGVTWTEAGSTTVSMGPAAVIGLVSTSDDATRLNRAEFTDVSVVGTGGVIETAGTFSALVTTYGTPSSTTTITVSGAGLTGDVTATAPAGFEVSSDGTTFGSTATFTPVSGSVSGTLLVRLGASAAATTYSGTVSFSSPGATTATAALPASTVSPKELTITGLSVVSRVYDGTTGATLTGTAALFGLLGSDDVSLDGTGSGTFNSPHVATANAVAVAGFSLGGPQAANYTLTQPTLPASILARALTVTANNASRTYGANNPGFRATITGFAAGESAATAISGAPFLTTTATRSSDAGTYPITPALGTLATRSDNYVFSTFSPGTLTVNKAALTIRIANQRKVAGEADPVLTFATRGLVNGDTAAAIITGLPTRAAGDAVGAYAITTGTLVLSAAGSVNYTLNTTTGIMAGSLQVTAAARPLFVTGAFVRGSGWVQNYLALPVFATGPKGTQLGFALGDGSSQLANASLVTWNNVNRISLQFSEPINAPSATSLTLVAITGTGVGTQTTITSTAVTLSEGDTVATWSVPTLTTGRFTLVLPAAAITSRAGGGQLDGDWTHASSTFATGSGDGTAGGDFRYQFRVLVGDINASGSVLANDVTGIQSALNAAVTTSNYRLDVNGSGTIVVTDANAVRPLVGRNLPTGGFAPVVSGTAGATVDDTFDLSFAENAEWREAITGITVGGTPLEPAAFDTTVGGRIRLDPAVSSLLQTSGSKTLLISAAGYADVRVTQALAAGVATQLGITTQPVGPAVNGGTLATAPVVRVQDRYGNTVTTSTALIVAAFEAGTGSWTLGGTTSRSAVAGVATFGGLTATGSGGPISGARIRFTSGGLTLVVSSAFMIPG